jgi:hypothetical protein
MCVLVNSGEVADMNVDLSMANVISVNIAMVSSLFVLPTSSNETVQSAQ